MKYIIIISLLIFSCKSPTKDVIGNHLNCVGRGLYVPIITNDNNYTLRTTGDIIGKSWRHTNIAEQYVAVGDSTTHYEYTYRAHGGDNSVYLYDSNGTHQGTIKLSNGRPKIVK